MSTSAPTATALRSPNSLAPRGQQLVELSLGDDQQPLYRILLPDHPGTIDIKAASLLQQALEAGSGCRLEITHEEEWRGGRVFSIGNTRRYGESGIVPTQDLQEEGYLLAEQDGDVFLVGGTRRGALSAVIALIEEDWGGRLYDRREGLRMPALPRRLPVTLREYAPPFKIRTMFQWESFDAEYQLFNRVGSSTSGHDQVPEEWGGSIHLPADFFVHTFMKLLPNEQYFAQHPEYFALLDGKRKPQGHGGGAQFCLTHPQVRRIVTERVLRELEARPQCRLFDVSMNDTGGGFCQCPACRQLAAREGSAAGPLLSFVNAVAEEVAKSHPDVEISTLAYLEANKPPRDIRPADHVIIRLCNDTASFPYPLFFLEESDVFFPNMKNWLRLGARLFIWDYVVDYKAWAMPRPNLSVIDHNVNTYARHGVYGLFLQSSHYGPGENRGKLRAWVYAHKMWDPSRSMAALVEDFNYGYFGAAAPLMQRYCDLLTQEWRYFHDHHSFRESAEYPLKFCFRDSFYPQARALFQQALALAQTQDEAEPEGETEVRHAAEPGHEAQLRGETKVRDAAELGRQAQLHDGAELANRAELRDKIELEYLSILFYRLQMIPPADDRADRRQYAADLDTFVQLTSKFHVEWMDEGVTKTAQRVLEWRRKYDIPSATPEQPVTVRLGPTDITRCADGGRVVDDISAPGGVCVELPIVGDGWSLQWFFGSALLNKVTYAVRIQLRADRLRPQGPACGLGIYSISAARTPLELVVDAARIPADGYGWLDCGTVQGAAAPSAYFYVAQVPHSAVAKVYVSAIELIPQLPETETSAP